MAITCTDQTSLVSAYTSVINHFKVTKIDFDIEGSGSSRRTMAATASVSAI